MGRVLSALLAVLLSCMPAFGEGWIIARIANGVSFSEDGKTWTPAQAGMEVGDGWIRTGPRGRAIVARGEERIVYRENSLAAIATSRPKGRKTSVTQQRGSLLLSIETRRRKHTTVYTPHVAAVVKGTVFEVSVNEFASEVRVDNGTVEVRDEAGRSVDVSKGNKATSSGRTISVAPANVSSLKPGSGNSMILDLAQTSTGQPTTTKATPARNSHGGSGNGE